uniref:beta-N-acetylhexosaminidase n=1 Tax=Strigamia maritima TaxID=126957 RepID=T1IV42_STRMM
MRTFLHHVFASLWRRKILVLVLLLVFVVSMMFFQYNSVDDDDSTLSLQSKLHNGGQRTLRTFETRGNNNNSDRFQHLLRSAEQQQRMHHRPVSGEQQRVAEDVEQGILPRILPSDRRMQEVIPNSGQIDVVLHPLKENEEHVDVMAGPQPHKKPPSREFFYGHGQVKEIPYQHSKLRHDDSNAIDGQIVPPGTPFVPRRRLVHLDLKGAPPKIVYLEKLMPILKGLGATGLLIEYEDMFPYDGPLKWIAAHNHYSKKEVRAILRLAKQNELEVIPLVQTFGHLEFVLKLENFQHLRELPAIPQAMCPSRNESFTVVQQLIDQVMDMHKGVRWLHIGCDEVFQLGVCSLCNQQPREALFLSHVARVAQYAREKYHVIPIVWDDMFHHMSTETLRSYDMGNLVEPMLWTYVNDIYRFISPNVWTVYSEVFPYIWAASAFKGAFGETLSIPIISRHLENNLAWIDVLNQEQRRFREIRGIAITGWQRYDHFAVLCELLPAAVPSLAVNVLATSNGYFNESLQSQLFDGLQCMKHQKYTTFIDLEHDPHLWAKLSFCFFPGVAFFKVTEHLSRLRQGVDEFLKSETLHKAWLTEYNVRRNFSSLTRIDTTMQELPRYLYDVETLIKHSRDALREAFDEYTVAEWIEQNVYPMLRKLELLNRAASSLKKLNTWPVRPFETLPDLQRFNIGIPDDNS